MVQAIPPVSGPAKPLMPADLEGDLIQRGHPLFGIVWINRQRMSGAPCFAGTRVPLKNLFDYLEGGDPLEEFLDGFPGVTREQAVAVIELASAELFEKLSTTGPSSSEPRILGLHPGSMVAADDFDAPLLGSFPNGLRS
jgi:uncharacterized protein (DUF433 family)